MVNPHPSNAKVTPQGGSHHSSGGGTGDSSVGTRSLYQADDQRNSKTNQTSVHKEGAGPVSGEYDTQKKVLEEEQNNLNIKDPLRPATLHGNEPSRGAKTDAMLQREDMEELSKKEHAGKGMGGASG